MFYTEKEAEKKMCPMAGAKENISYCIGSGCMAWRWTDKEYKLVKNEPCPDCPDAANKKYCETCLDEETYGRKHEYITYNRGYCGLAPRISHTCGMLPAIS